MKTKIASATLVLLVLIAPVLLLAEAPPEPPDPATQAQHQVSFLTKLLTLTADQQQQATTIFTTAATAESAVHDKVKVARQSLDAAVKSNETAKIDQIAASMGNLTAKLTSVQAKARAAFYQVLTADQQTKLVQFESARPPSARGGPGGPGGPEGPGGPGGPAGLGFAP
jgi:Spy/CpxP family protein refolding chaperone